jgi:adenylate cyclase
VIQPTAVWSDGRPALGMTVWPHTDWRIDLSGPTLTVGTTVQFDMWGDMGELSQMLRVIEDLGGGSWRVRPTSNARPLNGEYRRRQRARAKRRRS